MLPWKLQCQKYFINRVKAIAKPHTYHMFSIEDRPPPYFLDQILGDPVLNPFTPKVAKAKNSAKIPNFVL